MNTQYHYSERKARRMQAQAREEARRMARLIAVTLFISGMALGVWLTILVAGL